MVAWRSAERSAAVTVGTAPTGQVLPQNKEQAGACIHPENGPRPPHGGLEPQAKRAEGSRQGPAGDEQARVDLLLSMLLQQRREQGLLLQRVPLPL
jgi:hypothetical protein